MSDKSPAKKDIQAPLEKPAKAIIDPFIGFTEAQSASGWVLLGATIIAIALANSSFGYAYENLIHLRLGIRLGDFDFSKSLQHWVNDGLMSLFFFLLGLELKRELLAGQLSDFRRAGAVISAATGGVILPAGLYLAVANEPMIQTGWAMPVATDTAFALMVLVLLGDKIPAAVRAFMIGIAIIDDLAAIAIIALGYTKDIDMQWLIPSIFTMTVLFVMNITGIRHGLVYFLVGLVLWFQFLNFGLHGTLAGVIVAALAPVRPQLTRDDFLSMLRKYAARFERKQQKTTDTIFEEPEQQSIAADIKESAELATPALNRWESRLEKPISFLVMPLFAFMNAGVPISVDAMKILLASELSIAVPLGLLAGKPAGILLGVVIARKAGLIELPSGMNLKHVFGIGLVAGIGFTMSIFIATLSFGEASRLLDMAKQSIILSSLCAGITGYLWFRWAGRNNP